MGNSENSGKLESAGYKLHTILQYAMLSSTVKTEAKLPLMVSLQETKVISHNFLKEVRNSRHKKNSLILKCWQLIDKIKTLCGPT